MTLDENAPQEQGSIRKQGAAFYAVLVLYGFSPEESPAFRSFCEIFRPERSAGYACQALLLQDNSPQPHAVPQSLPPGLRVHYQHDSTNPGLARPYQQALANAQAEGTAWLLLLDQDTVLTAAWLDEALAVTQAVTKENVVAIIPRLLQDGLPLSPHRPMWYRGAPLEYAPGIKRSPLKVFNSGALLRVAALEACGGFPQDFPLDYLDHAVFHALEQRGGQIHLLASPLEHQLAGKHLDFVDQFGGSPRMQSTAAAESRFYWRFGTPYEKMRHILQRGHLVFRLLLGGKPAGALRLILITLG